MKTWAKRIGWVLAVLGLMVLGGYGKATLVDPIRNEYRDFQVMKRFIAQSPEFRRWAAGPPKAQPPAPQQAAPAPAK